MRVVRRVDLRDQGLKARLEDHEVQMRRAKIVAAGGPHQCADRPIHGNWIARGLDAAEIEPAALVGDEAPAQIHLGLPGILVLIEAFRQECQTSTSAPAIGRPLSSSSNTDTNSPLPGVGERTSESPL